MYFVLTVAELSSDWEPENTNIHGGYFVEKESKIIRQWSCVKCTSTFQNKVRTSYPSFPECPVKSKESRRVTAVISPIKTIKELGKDSNYYTELLFSVSHLYISRRSLPSMRKWKIVKKKNVSSASYVEWN